MNPYEPPETETTLGDADGEPKFKTNLRSLLIPTVVGAVVGSIALAPMTRGPGDPTGHGIAFGIGGIFSLVAALFFRAFKRQWKFRV